MKWIDAYQNQGILNIAQTPSANYALIDRLLNDFMVRTVKIANPPYENTIWMAYQTLLSPTPPVLRSYQIINTAFFLDDDYDDNCWDQLIYALIWYWYLHNMRTHNNLGV